MIIRAKTIIRYKVMHTIKDYHTSKDYRTILYDITRDSSSSYDHTIESYDRTIIIIIIIIIIY